MHFITFNLLGAEFPPNNRFSFIDYDYYSKSQNACHQTKDGTF
jgi:hypothetical protein